MAVNLDRGSNDLEEIIDKQKKIIDYLKKQTKKCDNKFTTFVKYTLSDKIRIISFAISLLGSCTSLMSSTNSLNFSFAARVNAV